MLFLRQVPVPPRVLDMGTWTNTKGIRGTRTQRGEAGMRDDLGVDQYMNDFREALERSGVNLTVDERTDIYNRAWEAVAKAIRVLQQQLLDRQ